MRNHHHPALFRLLKLVVLSAFLPVAEREACAQNVTPTTTPLATPLPAEGFLWNTTQFSLRTGQLGSESPGKWSAAFGLSRATGDYSFAAGWEMWATGKSAIALGNYGGASGWYSVALGWATAIGHGATAVGWDARADGNESVALGTGVTSVGISSTATGIATHSRAYGSFVVGRANGGVPLSQNAGTAWVATDPLFEVGNGVPGVLNGPAEIPSNAFTVFKSGDAEVGKDLKVKGVIRTTAPAGDLSMGEFATQP